MKRDELEKLVIDERKRVEAEQRNMVTSLVKNAEAEIVERIKKNPTASCWKSHVLKKDLGDLSCTQMFDIIKKFKQEMTEIDIVHEHSRNCTIPLWEEDDPEDHYYDHDLGCYYNLDLSGINQDRLEKFVKGNNTYKWYDRKQAHPSVARRLTYREPFHDFSENKGFRNADNKIERMIESHVKNGGCMANVLAYKIKNCADYKHNHTFRQAAKRYIDALEQPQNFSWITNWEWCMEQYVYQDGCVMNKHDARKYWGYEEICDICGKDHG